MRFPTRPTWLALGGGIATTALVVGTLTTLGVSNGASSGPSAFGVIALQPSASFDTTCPNPLTNTNVAVGAETVTCTVATTTTTLPVTTTTVPVTTTTVPATTTIPTTTVPVTTTTLPSAGLSIKVSGTKLVNSSGVAVQLRGVNRSGTEYACDQGFAIFDGASDAASVAAIASWHVNAVRIPLNEDCWLGINGVKPAYSGANYRNAILAYVNLLVANKIYPIVDLHVGAPGITLANVLTPMPDQDHSPAFWTSAATMFKNNPAVLFDLWNEPFPGNNTDSAASWACWKNGGTCPSISYTTAGMQELVNTVRATGATNVIMLGGIGYASVFDQWAANKPADPLNQLAASFHNYSFGGCTTAACWNSTLAQVGSVPLITGETGFDGYIETYMTWADTHGIGYLAWTWDTWGCSGGQALISDYAGTVCSPYGSSFKTHLGS